ncbi:hypothetical protein POM88_034742 [Heracleum sosnowskyi]|uniref:Uncharacterized protein n=1 Tax=Heracleum sosnowskyi TaxID=360622 RepID=A0AAD8HM40_9APIA|nr:hypothetical protein POM88_034742 [Heracleum sosnowskyi]
MQQSEETASLRRSGRFRKSVESSDIEAKVPRKHPIGRCSNKKHKSLAVEQEKQLQELTLVTDGCEMPPEETIDGIPVVEILSSPEEEKPKRDFLLLRKDALKPNPRVEFLPEDRQHLVNAASILKSQLVARLTSSAEDLRTKDMINLASRCYIALRELGDDYISFSTQVNKLIAQSQELEFAAKDLKNWNDGDLKARHIQQVQNLSEMTEKLFSAQDKLSRTKTQVELLRFKKEELTAVLLMTTEELSEEEGRIKTLTEERDRFKESYSEIKVGLEKLGAEKEEAAMVLKAINARYDAAKVEFERITNHMLQSMRRSYRRAFGRFSPSSHAAAPSTTSFFAKLATLHSTGFFQANKATEDQTSATAIGVSSEMALPS